MNLVVLQKNDFINDKTVRLMDRRFHHLVTVNRVEKNKQLACGLLNGNIGTGLVTIVTDRFVEMEVDLKDPSPDSLPLTLILALPRPKMLKRIIETATALGVKSIYLINAWRVEKSYWNSPVLDDDQLETYMILGLEQSRDTILPTIHKKRFFTRFVREELPGFAQNCLCITAHPKTSTPCPSRIKENTILAVGPEGGFIDREIETLEDIGFRTCHIGPRILRVETAVTYIIAKLFS